MPPRRKGFSGKFGDPRISENEITRLARRNVGGRGKFVTYAEYRAAVTAERERLLKNNSNLALVEQFEKSEAIRLNTGSPAVYRKEFAEIARIVCSVYGSTQVELAKFFRTEKDTVFRWIRDYPEFEKAVYDRSTEMNMQIMRRLARRAQGFYADTEKIFYDTKRGDVVRVPTKEYYAPSESAIIFWLKNRMPEHWKDTKDVTTEESRHVVMEIYKNFENMTTEQASDAYQDLLKIEGSPTEKIHSKEAEDIAYIERDPKADTGGVESSQETSEIVKKENGKKGSQAASRKADRDSKQAPEAD